MTPHNLPCEGDPEEAALEPEQTPLAEIMDQGEPEASSQVQVISQSPEPSSEVETASTPVEESDCLTEAGKLDIRKRNRRYVQIDAVGVALGNASSPFLPVFLTRMGASNVQVGLLSSMPGVTGLILALVVGSFLQSRRNIIPWFSTARLLVISAYALTGLAPFLVPREYVVLAVLIIWAVATMPQTMVNVAFSVVMNSVAGPDGRFDLMSRRWSILGFTTAITVALVGQVLDRIAEPLNYQVVFLVLSLGGLVSYYFSSRIHLLDTPHPQTLGHVPIGARLRSYLELVRQEPAFISFTLKRFVYLSGITLALPLFPLYFVRELDAPDSWIGLVSTAQTAVLLFGYPMWARLTRRRGSRFVLLASTFMVALYPGLVALTRNQTMIIGLAALAGTFQAGMDLVFFDELMKTIPPQHSPTFVSLAQSLQFLSSILAPLLGTYLAAHTSIATALMFSAGLRLAGFILFAMPLTRKRPKQLTAEKNEHIE
jgi:Na+/melibiose symporter-like transporter